VGALGEESLGVFPVGKPPALGEDRLVAVFLNLLAVKSDGEPLEEELGI
jgi:hypothetical protein